jgi:protoporphyrinogen oxidase
MTSRKVGVVGAGMLGLTLAHRLSKAGHSVDLIEGGPQIGGLAVPHDYGEFVWDKYYHCILPQDQALIALLRELGLEGDLRWRTTGTGYYARNTFFNMNGNADFLRFPLLSLIDKFRLGMTVVRATRFSDPFKLYEITAEEWLTRLCGRNAYAVFWKPLLKAKFGPYHDQVAAVFIWATLKRLFGARGGGDNQEKLGYVSGGYARILGRMQESLVKAGVSVKLGTQVTRIAGEEGGARIEWRGGAQKYDQVYFTAPTGVARKVAGSEFAPHVEKMGGDYPTSGSYLGVICMGLVLKKELMPYYVLNIGEEGTGLTGVIGMTNLVDSAAETKGRALTYLPRYLGSEDPAFESSDAEIESSFIDKGLKRLFKDLSASDIVGAHVHRARLVQPLPLARKGGGGVFAVPAGTKPFQILNTSMLRCATLNNNEVVGLVDEFLAKNPLG